MGVSSEIGIKTVSRRVKNDKDTPSARNGQHHQEEHDSNAMTMEKFMHVLPSKAAAKRESASGTLDEIGIKHGDARNRSPMTTKALPGYCQRQDKHSQKQASCCQ